MDEGGQAGDSTALRRRVEQYQARGQWGPRHFDKHVFNVPIPRFDDDNDLHIELAEAAQTAENVAAQVERGENEYFVRTRRRIRSALAEDGVAGEMEELVKELLAVPRGQASG